MFKFNFRPRDEARSHGVMVSTQDSESCNPSSNLGGTYVFSSREFIERADMS